MENKKQETNEQKTAAEKAASDFLNTAFFNVELTYTFTNPETKICFYMDLEFSDAEKENAQKFYALSEAERAERAYSFHRDRLISLTAAPPSGLPGFDDIYLNTGADTDKARAKKALAKYFETETPILKMLVTDAMTRYSNIAKPLEFFR